MIVLPLFALLIGLFVVLKLSFLGIRPSDTNVYFYTAYELLQGKILYKDIFFTNLPLFPYISSLYIFLTQGNILLYYLTSVFESIATAVLVYFIIVHSKHKKIYGVLGAGTYLFSFVVLATTDHQTGVFTASFLATLSYFCLLKKKYIFAGFIVGLSLLIKLYFLPIFAAYVMYLIFFQRKDVARFLLGSIAAFFLILFPTILLSGNSMFQDVFLYSFFRGVGLNKLTIFIFFILHDPVIFLLLLYNIFSFKRNVLLFLVTSFSLLFFVFYQDVYFLYLNLLIPFAAISAGDAISFIERKFGQRIMMGTIILGGMVMIFGVYSYSNLSKTQYVFPASELISAIQKEKPGVLYGSMEITPALSYLSGVPLLNNIIDTNTNIFRKKIYNARDLTQSAIQKKAVLVMIGSQITEDKSVFIGEIFDPELVRNHCEYFYQTNISIDFSPVKATLWRCSKETLDDSEKRY